MSRNQSVIQKIERNTDLGDILSNKSLAAQACALLKALANGDRLLILCQLVQGEKNVRELEQSLEVRQPTLSQQLTVLRGEELVNTQRKGKYIYYSLASQEALQIIQTLYHIYCTGKKLPHSAEKWMEHNAETHIK